MPPFRHLARLSLALFPLATGILAGCSRGPAWGSENAVIAAVDPSLRDELEPVIRGSLEREVFTTRLDPVFDVTFANPDSLGDFQRWRRIVVIQPATEGSRAARLLSGKTLEEARSRGVVAEVSDEWALGQSIWVVAAPTPEATASLARASLDSLYQVLYQRYAESEVEQMWLSGRDSALFEELTGQHGFGIVLPQVYRPAPASAPPDTRVWYNDNPRRVVALHWTDLPDSLTPDALLAIRRAWGVELFPDDTISSALEAAPDSGAPAEPVLVERATLDGRPAVRLQGVWHNARDVTAGVFVTYGVACGDRFVLLDGNLFAPEREKLPYVIQFDQIFRTFHCAEGA